jgi:hypothetical protein
MEKDNMNPCCRHHIKEILGELSDLLSPNNTKRLDILLYSYLQAKAAFIYNLEQKYLNPKPAVVLNDGSIHELTDTDFEEDAG